MIPKAAVVPQVAVIPQVSVTPGSTKSRVQAIPGAAVHGVAAPPTPVAVLYWASTISHLPASPVWHSFLSLLAMLSCKMYQKARQGSIMRSP